MGKHSKVVQKKTSKQSNVSLIASSLVLGGSWIGLVSAGSGESESAQFSPGFAMNAVVLEQPVINPPVVEKTASEKAVSFALSEVGKPYVWGAKGPTAFDCSGLTQFAWKQVGVRIGEDTYHQINNGVAVSRKELSPGDLIFPWIGHVVMYIGDGKVVEAPGRGMKVRVTGMPNRYIAIRRIV